MNHNTVTIGTRGSQLALWQTEWVREQLTGLYPQLTCQVKTVKTIGDKILDVPLAKIGDKGLFTKELDVALLNGEIDLAVHSLKDLPTQLPDGIVIAAITERWDPRDSLITKTGFTFRELPPGAVVATGSLRRRAQVLHHRPDVQIVELRGNLNTRFRKFDENSWDAMILATAGVERLGWSDRISEKISTELILPAVGQGAFGVVCRANDEKMLNLLAPLNHLSSRLATLAERSLMRTLEGGCQIPIGALGILEDGQLSLAGCIGSLDGKQLVRDSLSIPLTGEADEETAVELGERLAKKLLDMGGEEILNAIIAGGISR